MCVCCVKPIFYNASSSTCTFALPASTLQLDGARPQQHAAASAAAAAITAVQQPQQPAAPAPVLLEAARVAQPPIGMTAALDPVSDLSMALSSEADAVAVADVVPLLRVAADPAVAAAIKQGLKQLYAAVCEGASVPEVVLQAITGSLRGLAVPACGTTAAIPTAAAAAAAHARSASTSSSSRGGQQQEAKGAEASSCSI